MKRRQAHSLTPYPHEQVQETPKQVHFNASDTRSTTDLPMPRIANYIPNKHIMRMKPKRSGIKKMAFLLSISPTTTQ
jgi:hypothetical protein